MLVNGLLRDVVARAGVSKAGKDYTRYEFTIETTEPLQLNVIQSLGRDGARIEAAAKALIGQAVAFPVVVGKFGLEAHDVPRKVGPAVAKVA